MKVLNAYQSELDLEEVPEWFSKEVGLIANYKHLVSTAYKADGDKVIAQTAGGCHAAHANLPKNAKVLWTSLAWRKSLLSHGLYDPATGKNGPHTYVEEDLYEQAHAYWKWMIGDESPFRKLFKNKDTCTIVYDKYNKAVAYKFILEPDTDFFLLHSLFVSTRFYIEKKQPLELYTKLKAAGASEVDARYLSFSFTESAGVVTFQYGGHATFMPGIFSRKFFLKGGPDKNSGIRVGGGYYGCHRHYTTTKYNADDLPNVIHLINKKVDSNKSAYQYGYEFSSYYKNRLAPVVNSHTLSTDKFVSNYKKVIEILEERYS